MNSYVPFGGPYAAPAWAFGAATTRKPSRPAWSSFARLMLVLLLQAKFSVSGEPPPPSPTSSTRTPPAREQKVANASCAFAGCALTVDNGTSVSAETTTYVVTTTSELQQSKDHFSTTVIPAAHEGVSAAPSSSSNRPAVRSNSSLGLSGGNASEIRGSSVQLGEVPAKESPRSSQRPKEQTTETTESATEGTTVPGRTTPQPPADVTRAGKPPRRKFRKGQRRNGGGDRRNASLSSPSSAWREETRFLWEPRDPVPVPGYAFGLAFGVVALAGLVGAGTMCGGGGGGAKPMLGTAWATAVTALVVTSAASRAAALLLLPAPPWRRLLQAASPAGLFLALALFWLALCRPALSRLVAAGACFVALWVLPIVAESQAGALVDARLLLVTRLASLAAACLAILVALVAFPWLRRMALRSQDALLCSALAKMQRGGLCKLSAYILRHTFRARKPTSIPGDAGRCGRGAEAAAETHGPDHPARRPVGHAAGPRARPAAGPLRAARGPSGPPALAVVDLPGADAARRAERRRLPGVRGVPARGPVPRGGAGHGHAADAARLHRRRVRQARRSPLQRHRSPGGPERGGRAVRLPVAGQDGPARTRDVAAYGPPVPRPVRLQQRVHVQVLLGGRRKPRRHQQRRRGRRRLAPGAGRFHGAGHRGRLALVAGAQQRLLQAAGQQHVQLGERRAQLRPRLGRRRRRPAAPAEPQARPQRRSPPPPPARQRRRRRRGGRQRGRHAGLGRLRRPVSRAAPQRGPLAGQAAEQGLPLLRRAPALAEGGPPTVHPERLPVLPERVRAAQARRGLSLLRGRPGRLAAGQGVRGVQGRVAQEPPVASAAGVFGLLRRRRNRCCRGFAATPREARRVDWISTVTARSLGGTVPVRFQRVQNVGLACREQLFPSPLSSGAADARTNEGRGASLLLNTSGCLDTRRACLKT
ncbi:uncharacterized protein [Dermacentor albipictus]|uniref:uncharacterized protein isoform X1 n=1 Tax=Dermacentor albipictus TaxID=60249 RepID=UPI0038FC3D58